MAMASPKVSILGAESDCVIGRLTRFAADWERYHFEVSVVRSLATLQVRAVLRGWCYPGQLALVSVGLARRACLRAGEAD